jgi:DNA-binding MarR family transcriptional regulator
MLSADVISYTLIGLSHLFVIEQLIMHDHNEKPALTLQDALARLIYELHKYGPLRLVDDKGHHDFVGRKTRFCCSAEPFLEAMNMLENKALVRQYRNQADQSLYSLTDKGFLLAYLLKTSASADCRCYCQECSSNFERLLSEMKDCGPLKLVTKDDCEFPHLESIDLQFCLEDESLLQAITRLERDGFVRMNEDFSFHLTRKGSLSTQLMLSPFSKLRAQASEQN